MMTGLAAGTNGENLHACKLAPASPDTTIVEGRPAANTAHERIRELHRAYKHSGDPSTAYEALAGLPNALPEIADALEAARYAVNAWLSFDSGEHAKLDDALARLNEKLT